MFEVLRTYLRTSKISWVEFVKESAYKNRRYAKFCSCSTLLWVILSAFNALSNVIEPHMNFLMLSNSLQEVSNEKQENPLTHLSFLQNLNFNGSWWRSVQFGQRRNEDGQTPFLDNCITNCSHLKINLWIWSRRPNNFLSPLQNKSPWWKTLDRTNYLHQLLLPRVRWGRENRLFKF